MNRLEELDRLHNTLELILAISNKYCEKHLMEPEFCGATKEARETLGQWIKLYGLYRLVTA